MIVKHVDEAKNLKINSNIASFYIKEKNGKFKIYMLQRVREDVRLYLGETTDGESADILLLEIFDEIKRQRDSRNILIDIQEIEANIIKEFGNMYKPIRAEVLYEKV